MKKVTKNISAAFKAGTSKRVNATHTDGNVMFLHGNQIARKNDGKLEVCWAGWVTATTAERINGILREYGSSLRVCRRNFKPFASYINAPIAPMDSIRWITVSDVKI